MKKSLLTYLKSNRGVALIYVIFLATVIAAAGIILWQTSAAGIRASQTSEMESKAYYNARSAVEIAMGLILVDVEDRFETDDTYYGKLGNPQLSTSPMYNPDGSEAYDFAFTINIENDEEKDETVFTVNSSGISGGSGKEKTATNIQFIISMTDIIRSVEGGSDTIGSDIPAVISKDGTTNYVLFVSSTIDLGSGSPYIIGQAGTNKGPVLFNYSSRIVSDDGGPGILYLGPEAEVEYPQNRDADWEEIHFGNEIRMPAVPALPGAPNIPEIPGLPDDSSVVWSDSVLTGGVVNVAPGTIQGFRRISLGWNDVLTLSLSGDAAVVVDKFESSGTLRIDGTGNLLLVVNSGLDRGSRTMINANGDSERLTIYYAGKEISLGSGSAIAATIFAPDASLDTGYPTDISGDIIVGGKSITFNGLSHDGTLFALNQNANIKYSGNRSLTGDIRTDIFSNGKKTEIAAAKLTGDMYLSNTDAEFSVYGGSILDGNVITAGKKVEIMGGARLNGHIIAPDTRASISVTGGARYGGCIVTGGKTVNVSGGSNLDGALIFAPNAAVKMDGGVHIIGGIIADTFSATSGTLRYEEMRVDDLPVFIEPTEDERTNWRVNGIWKKG